MSDSRPGLATGQYHTCPTSMYEDYLDFPLRENNQALDNLYLIPHHHQVFGMRSARSVITGNNLFLTPGPHTSFIRCYSGEDFSIAGV